MTPPNASAPNASAPAYGPAEPRWGGDHPTAPAAVPPRPPGCDLFDPAANGGAGGWRASAVAARAAQVATRAARIAALRAQAAAADAAADAAPLAGLTTVAGLRGAMEALLRASARREAALTRALLVALGEDA